MASNRDRNLGKFEDVNVGEIAERLKEKLKEVSQLKGKYEEASRDLRRAETELANIRTAFTHAVDGQLDMSVLNQQPVKSYPVPETP